MTKKNIRSKYIKNLLGESKELTKELEETTKETLKDILKETVNAEFRNILNEAPEDYKEEEVAPENPMPAEQPDGQAAQTADATGVPAVTPDAGAPAEGMEGAVEPEQPAMNGETQGNDELWNSLEQYKDADGEYDLTGFDAKEAARVLKVMDPNKDGIRIVKDGNRIELKDDNADTEYVIELDPEEENVYDIEMSPEPMGESDDHGNVGYMGNRYQKKTAMTTPDNHEPSPMKGYRDWDKGARHGTEKRYGKSKGDGQPYDDELDEGIILEVETECGETEAGLKTGNGRGVGQRSKNWKGQKTPREKRHREETGVNPSANESIKRKANEIFLENKELKKVASKIKDRLEESYLMNYNLGKIVKIITENSTTRDEKINIVNRFSQSKSIEESKGLYEAISKELASAKTTSNVDSVMNGQVINESSKWQPSIVETSMYRSEDLHNTLDLMERMDRLGKKNPL